MNYLWTAKSSCKEQTWERELNAGQTPRVLLTIWIVPISSETPTEKGMRPLQEMLQAHGEIFICCFANQHAGIFLFSEHGGLINIKEFKAQELF